MLKPLKKSYFDDEKFQNFTHEKIPFFKQFAH